MDNPKQVVVRFGEIWLKGKNRPEFIGQLKSNIEHALEGYGASVYYRRDHFLVDLEDKSKMNGVLKELKHVFGVSWFAPVAVSENSLDSILSEANRIVGRAETVRIVAHRSYKKVDFDSHDIVGEFIKKSGDAPFRIDRDSRKTLFVNVTGYGTLLFRRKIPGPGGLPVGSSGTAVSLLSGGIDSPVASYYAMKRGLRLSYLHVHGFRDAQEALSSKIPKIIERLSVYGTSVASYYAPFHVFQAATLRIHERYELVLFKLFMHRMADKIAGVSGADAIVTGESLGQVASQTASNISSSQSGVGTLIVRPLIGFDKEEIIDMAKSIGTYGISVQRYRDVCSINAKRPATSTNAAQVERLYKECGLDSAVEKTLSLTTMVKEGRAQPFTISL